MQMKICKQKIKTSLYMFDILNYTVPFYQSIYLKKKGLYDFIIIDYAT